MSTNFNQAASVTEKTLWEIGCYGLPEIGLKLEVERSLKFYGNDKAMVITSWLSDVQQLIEFGKHEDARQLINQIKWIVNNVNENGNFVER